MSSAIQAVEALLQHHPAAGKSFTDFETLFNSQDDFLTKVKTFDQLLDQYRQLEDIAEYLFDLLMIHHLEKNTHDEDYFDSKEWLDIEDKTLERGTELLNILLYISESKETEAPVSLDDFLYEFLLVDEDEFQDEHRIYESLIEHNELVDEDMGNIRAVADELPESSEIKELFVPIVLFFQHADSNAISNDIYKELQPVERGLLASLLSYKQV
jgi:enoyl reductase-like protein